MLGGLSVSLRGRHIGHSKLDDEPPLGGTPYYGKHRHSRRAGTSSKLLLVLLALYLVSLAWRQQPAVPVRRVALDGEAGTGADLATTPPVLGNRRLLLSSHGRLQWLDLDTKQASVLHEGRGVYYGVAPAPTTAEGGAGTLWVVSRPHNWREPEPGVREAALLLDSHSGALLRELPLPSQFTHDALRYGSSLYVADTGHGSVWELALPELTVKKELSLFTPREHVNTLALWPSPDPHNPAPQLMAVLHNLGPSQLVRIDLASGAVVKRYTRVGDKSHGLSLWRGTAIMLSSGEGSLIRVDLEQAEAQGAAYTPEVLWTDPQRTFMKGLTVISDVAYFGISAWGSRQERDDVNKTSEVAAFDLVAHKLLWRVKVDTRGLLNVVSAPHLSVSSTSVALDSWAPAADAAGAAVPVLLNDAGEAVTGVAAGVASGKMAWVPWGTGGEKRPRSIKLEHKAAIARMNPARYPQEMLGEAAFVPLSHIDVTSVVDMLHAEAKAGLWDLERSARENAVLGGREGNMQKFKPGTQTVHLVFSSQDAGSCYFFPYWLEKWRAAVLPLLQTVMGWYGVPAEEAESRVVRLQLARMGPGGAILKHADKGGWAVGLHRVHIPLITNPDVEFLMQSDAAGSFVSIPVNPGDVFEINNAVPHEVHNSKTEERVHLLLDFAEAPLQCGTLQKGQRCEYMNQAGIVCPPIAKP